MIAKKGQGLSLNTVIIAIIVLVVLVVLVMIFTGYFGKIFTPTVGDCGTQGGKCAKECNTGDVGYVIQNAKGCPPPLADPTLKLCCAKVGGITE